MVAGLKAAREQRGESKRPTRSVGIRIMWAQIRLDSCQMICRKVQSQTRLDHKPR